MKPNEHTIINAVCDHFGVTQKWLRSDRRDSTRSHARQIAMYLLKSILDYSFSESAKALGRNDHTTARHGFIRVGKGLHDGDERICKDVGDIREALSKCDVIMPPERNQEAAKICGDMASTLRQVAAMLESNRERLLTHDAPRLF